MKHGEFMTFENEKLNEMRVWLYNADELHIENKVLHSFTRSSKKYAKLNRSGKGVAAVIFRTRGHEKLEI